MQHFTHIIVNQIVMKISPGAVKNLYQNNCIIIKNRLLKSLSLLSNFFQIFLNFICALSQFYDNFTWNNNNNAMLTTLGMWLNNWRIAVNEWTNQNFILKTLLTLSTSDDVPVNDVFDTNAGFFWLQLNLLLLCSSVSIMSNFRVSTMVHSNACNIQEILLNCTCKW